MKLGCRFLRTGRKLSEIKRRKGGEIEMQCMSPFSNDSLTADHAQINISILKSTLTIAAICNMQQRQYHTFNIRHLFVSHQYIID